MAQRIDQQPRGIATRAQGAAKGFLGRLHAGLHTDDIADFGGKLGIEANDEICRALGVARHAIKKGLQQRAGRFGLAVNHQIIGNFGRIFERPSLGAGLNKEIERVVDGHIGGQIDLDLQLCHRIGKHIARQPVAIEILLIIHKMIGRRHFQRVRHHPRPAMRCRAQADHLRTQRHRAVIFVVGEVIDAGEDRHVIIFQG